MSAFEISPNPIDEVRLTDRLSGPEKGALVTFRGTVRSRNRGRSVTALEYEAYPELARTVGDRIVAEANERFSFGDCLCVHRVGKLEAGEVAVWIGVGAGHRGQGFQACRFLIEEIKERVPIWKKEFYEDGTAEWL